MTDELAPFPVDTNMMVLAKDPQQMQAAQADLIGWYQEQILVSQAELNDAEANLAQAQKSKWATAGWKRQVRLAKGRLTFREKCLAALEAGYCIVPDFPTQVFAVRTKRTRPRKNMITSTSSWVGTPQAQQSEGLPVGEGEYQSPHASLRERRIPYTDSDGKARTEIRVWADEFTAPDFPMKTVKPVILDATNRAMVHKIFDEMGVLPARPQARRGGDPIVTGRVTRREGNREFGLSFLIAWWIDTRDL